MSVTPILNDGVAPLRGGADTCRQKKKEKYKNKKNKKRKKMFGWGDDTNSEEINKRKNELREETRGFTLLQL